MIIESVLNMNNNWMDQQVSLYATHSDNKGQPATLREILLTKFGRDLPAICELRKLDRLAPDYKIKSKPFKATLQCYTPAALMANKAAGQTAEISRSGLMQLDFDYDDISQFDLQELKQAVFDLPFIAFCGLSCSGYGFYALALIAEPQRLAEYAEQCFTTLKEAGIKADESKGKKPENLRYLSYDASMLIKDNPEPLRIKHFKAQQLAKKVSTDKATTSTAPTSDAILNAALKELRQVQSGKRWATVQKFAYTIGGLDNKEYLHLINKAIQSNSVFEGEEGKYIKCAEKCFNAGLANVFTA
jgi:hypothetical protein